jgi:predicted RNA-binding Zn-ribbon protein involved in translation (DUF1610 family)
LKLIPARRFLGFDNKSKLDVIVTTSSITESSKGAKVIRTTTGIGQVQGVSNLARFFGKCFRKKEINISMSKAVHFRPINDLILLGGPAKNEFSSHFIKKLSKEAPDLKLMVDDEKGIVTVNGKKFQFDHHNIQDGIPSKDIGLVVIWKNPFSSLKKRAIYCAGFTSYGTSGCSMWLFEDILTNLGHKASELFNIVGKKNPCFLALLEMDIVNGEVTFITPLEIIPIKECNYLTVPENYEKEEFTSCFESVLSPLAKEKPMPDDKVTCPKCGVSGVVGCKQDHDALSTTFHCKKCGYEEETLCVVL